MAIPLAFSGTVALIESMVKLAVPALKLRTVCDWFGGSGESVRIATPPVGVPVPGPAATDVVTVMGVPCVMLVEESCREVVVGLNMTEFQLFTSTLASTEPSPLARS